MTEMLKKAFAEASKLDGADQDTIGQWLLDELASQRRWDAAFADSENQLARLADEALREHHDGRTSELDPDTL